MLRRRVKVFFALFLLFNNFSVQTVVGVCPPSGKFGSRMVLHLLWPRATSSYVVLGVVCACTVMEKLLLSRASIRRLGPNLAAPSVNVSIAAQHAALPQPLQHVHILAHLLGGELHRSTVVGTRSDILIRDASHDLLIDRVVGVKLADGVVQAVDGLVFNFHFVVI